VSELTARDHGLIATAKALVAPIAVPGGSVGAVGAVLRTGSGQTYQGICLHLVCGLGVCAEHTALGTMVTSQGPGRIDTIVAANASGVIAPCGRCRELLRVASLDAASMWVIVSEHQKVRLASLMPHPWLPTPPADAS